MQMFAYRKTMAGARPVYRESPAPDPVVPRLVESRSRLLKDCVKVREDIERLNAQRAEAQQAIDAANAALKALHEKWAEDGAQKGQAQWRVVRAPMSLKEVVRRIAKATGISREDIMSDRRTKKIALARQAVFYWASRRTGHSFAQLGRLMGRDHTTALHNASAYPKKRAKMGRTLRSVR